MEHELFLNLIGLAVALSPLILLVYIGPEVNEKRLIYFVVGLSVSGVIGVILNFAALDIRLWFLYDYYWQARLTRELFAAVVEEIIRYPGILLAQLVGIKYLMKFQPDSPELNQPAVSEEKYDKLVDDKFTTISDPHGMGMYFGFGYGYGELIAFYIMPTLGEFFSGNHTFDPKIEVMVLMSRITGLFAHTALTYLAMAITSQKGFWRITILTHLLSNLTNRMMIEFAANDAAVFVYIMFSRFAILVVAYFLLRPRIRYLSPAVLIFILVVLFLGTILISTIVVLIFSLFSVDVFPRPI